MKRILNFTSLSIVVIAVLFLYSCESEPTDPVKPVVTLTSSSDITVEPGESFTVDFSASKGDNSALKAITVYEDGVKLPASRLTYNGVAASANAVLLFGDDVDGLTWSIDIVAHSVAASTVTYEVEVQDQASQTQSLLVNVTTVGTPPTLTATPPTTFEVMEGSTNVFKLTAVKGSGDLVSIEVRESDVKVDASRLSWNGESMVGMDNPFLLGDTEKGGFEETRLEIDLPMSVGTFVYSIILTDEFSLTSSVEYIVTTTPSGTPVEMRENLLFNADGLGLGGLDLDTGMNVPAASVEAEIRDNGIDINLPPADNWLRTISPVNGASMKYLRAGENGLPEGFTFASIEFKQDLEDLFANGVDLMGGATEFVEIEDVFIVSKDDKYWVLEVIEVITDPNNNTDQYKFDVKY